MPDSAAPDSAVPDSAAPDRSAVPALRAHYRLQWEPAQDCHVLLYPEGMIKLNGSAGEILSCVDGSLTVGQIIETLANKFPGSSGLAEDTLEFLRIAHDQRWLCFN